MKRQTLSVGPAPNVLIENVPGDLRVLGWERNEILAKTDDDILDLKAEGDHVSIACDGDLILNLPRAAALKIQSVEGDISARGLIGALDIRNAAGDVAIRDSGSIEVGLIEGNFSLRGAGGDVHVASVEGDVSVRDVQGNILFDSIEADLFLQGARGNVRAFARGDATLNLEPQAGKEYELTSEDDLLLRMPKDADATLTLMADSEDDIRVDLPGVSRDKSMPRTIVLGNGAAKIKLSAGGDLLITSKESEWESAAEFDFDFGGFGAELGEQISRRVQAATARAAQRAEEAARRATRGAERKARRAEQAGRAASRRWSFNFPFETSGSAKPPQPVSDEERLTILKMLQDKKITSEEADNLLAALEGGE